MSRRRGGGVINSAILSLGLREGSHRGERRHKNRSEDRFIAPDARVLVVDDAPLLRLYPDKAASTPILSLTANAVNGAREYYIDAGFNDYLTKPVMADELEKMLLKYLPTEKYAALCKRLGDAVDRVDWGAIRACVNPGQTEEADA